MFDKPVTADTLADAMSKPLGYSPNASGIITRYWGTTENRLLEYNAMPGDVHFNVFSRTQLRKGILRFATNDPFGFVKAKFCYEQKPKASLDIGAACKALAAEFPTLQFHECISSGGSFVMVWIHDPAHQDSLNFRLGYHGIDWKPDET